MARPQAEDYDERKQSILDTAARVFADGGYHKASISQIADACGMSKSLIYHYFKSKQSMLYHAMLDHVIELDKLAQEVMAMDISAEERLKKIIRRYLIVYENTVPQHHLMINELKSLTAEQKAEVVGLQNSVVHAFADLANEISPLPFEKHKAKTAISMLMLGMVNWTYIWFKPDGPVSSEQLAAIITKMFIDGLKGLTEDVFV
ncbi:TetR family transcriptional regulator [Kordiimonas sediminis]|uniref:TetR family transcriptional regulator n=1 Tax=Kordiimonas sediminis TaxID=1735581 RepID=A0A919AJ19_9PROT|nr:TetR/AcrR family transcriptional regulator [Kordiimonas sediminis]GHF10951.1 TetR family transcriptional regulator [Kordiimonas sediminis]